MALFIKGWQGGSLKGSNLPSGFTQLSYIESTGTQYIDTEFKANNNTRVIVDVQYMGSASNQIIFGARTAAASKNYSLLATVGNYRSDYNTEYSQNFPVNGSERYVIDKNKETTTIDGTTQSYTNASFQCDYALCLFALNNAGTVQWYSRTRMYSCRIYDNGTLVRDFIPCQNAEGTVGLYDMVGKEFYGNAGTGTFIGV